MTPWADWPATAPAWSAWVPRKQARLAVLEWRYAYNGAGQLRQRQNSLRGDQTFEYGAMGRILAALLTASSGAFSPERFVFDPASNLLSPFSAQEAAAWPASAPPMGA